MDEGKNCIKSIVFFYANIKSIDDLRIPIKFKGTFYKNSTCPILLYGIECWAIISRSDMFIK